MCSLAERELAWAAGFFDGEGTTCLHSSHGISLQISVANTNRSILERFQKAVGGRGFIYGPQLKAGNKPVYCWMNHRQVEISEILAELWPYLSDQKQKQALTAKQERVSRIDTKKLNRLNASCRRGHSVKRTIFTSKGYRRCLECSNLRAQDRRAALKGKT